MGEKNKKSFEVQVECYSGYKGQERPVKFTLGKNQLEVQEILDRWYSPDSTDFKVKASDGNLYILRHHQEDESLWTLESLVGNP